MSLEFLLVAYFVDGSQARNVKQGQTLLGHGLPSETERRVDVAGALYVGCNFELTYIKLPSVALATDLPYSMTYLFFICFHAYMQFHKCASPVEVVLRPDLVRLFS